MIVCTQLTSVVEQGNLTCKMHNGAQNVDDQHKPMHILHVGKTAMVKEIQKMHASSTCDRMEQTAYGLCPLVGKISEAEIIYGEKTKVASYYSEFINQICYRSNHQCPQRHHPANHQHPQQNLRWLHLHRLQNQQCPHQHQQLSQRSCPPWSLQPGGHPE